MIDRKEMSDYEPSTVSSTESNSDDWDLKRNILMIIINTFNFLTIMVESNHQQNQKKNPLSDLVFQSDSSQMNPAQ